MPWEDAVGEAYKCKKLRYSNLAPEAGQKGWRTWMLPVEVGYRGFVAMAAEREGSPKTGH